MLIIGPWNHGGTQHVRTYPGGSSSMTSNDQVVVAAIGFLKDVLNGRKLFTYTNPIQYFVMQEEQWHQTETWPPAVSNKQFFLELGGENLKLSTSQQNIDATASIQINTGNGKAAAPAPQGNTRWEAMLYPLDLIQYDFSSCDYVCFTSPPLSEAMTVVGQAVVTLWLQPQQIDTPIVVYLLCSDKSTKSMQKSHYVTEGHFNIKHAESDPAAADQRLVVDGLPFHSFTREQGLSEVTAEAGPVRVQISLMPTAFKFMKGQCLQLSIGVSDSRHFGTIKEKEKSAMHKRMVLLRQDGSEPCRLQLPTLIEPAPSVDDHVFNDCRV